MIYKHKVEVKLDDLQKQRLVLEGEGEKESNLITNVHSILDIEQVSHSFSIEP
jgi:hypothetical protein